MRRAHTVAGALPPADRDVRTRVAGAGAACLQTVSSGPGLGSVVLEAADEDSTCLVRHKRTVAGPPVPADPRPHAQGLAYCTWRRQGGLALWGR